MGCMFLLSYCVIVKPGQADDFLTDGSVRLVHLDTVEPGTQGQGPGDPHSVVPAVGTQLQHCQRTLLRQQPVQDLPYTQRNQTCKTILINR